VKPLLIAVLQFAAESAAPSAPGREPVVSWPPRIMFGPGEEGIV